MSGFSLHGFTLRASPAVKHSVSPPGTVDPLTAAGLIPQHIKTQKSAPNNSLTHIEKKLYAIGDYFSLPAPSPQPHIERSLYTICCTTATPQYHYPRSKA